MENKGWSQVLTLWCLQPTLTAVFTKLLASSCSWAPLSLWQLWVQLYSPSPSSDVVAPLRRVMCSQGSSLCSLGPSFSVSYWPCWPPTTWETRCCTQSSGGWEPVWGTSLEVDTKESQRPGMSCSMSWSVAALRATQTGSTQPSLQERMCRTRAVSQTSLAAAWASSTSIGTRRPWRSTLVDVWGPWISVVGEQLGRGWTHIHCCSYSVCWDGSLLLSGQFHQERVRDCLKMEINGASCWSFFYLTAKAIITTTTTTTTTTMTTRATTAPLFKQFLCWGCSIIKAFLCLWQKRCVFNSESFSYRKKWYWWS